MIQELYWKYMKEALDQVDSAKVSDACDEIMKCQQNAGQLFVCGNGGSSSTAEHATCDLSKGLTMATGAKYRSQCLTSNTSLLTAWSNDAGYENALAEILSIQANTNDVLFVVTGSGNSPNILTVVAQAKKIGMQVIALTGFNGGHTGQYADIEIRVRSNDMQIIENVHLSIVHLIYKIISKSEIGINVKA